MFDTLDGRENLRELAEKMAMPVLDRVYDPSGDFGGGCPLVERGWATRRYGGGGTGGTRSRGP